MLTAMTETGRPEAKYTSEWAPFPLAEGVSHPSQLAASDLLQPDLLSKQPGFLHRELFKDADGRWMDTVNWHSLDDAQRAAEIFLGLPCAQSLIGLIDETSMTMLHLEPARSYT
jgi:hypothetical protein